MPLFILVLAGFWIYWPIASSTLATDQFDNIISVYDDELLSYDMAIDDKDIDYDLLSEDYLDYDNWANETERETRGLRSTQAYKDVTKSSTGNYTLGYILYISYL